MAYPIFQEQKIIISQIKIRKEITMKSNKPQSVQGFLTGTKLLTSKMKTHNKTKTHRTGQSLNTPSSADNQSLPQPSPKRSRESYKKKGSGNQSDAFLDPAQINIGPPPKKNKQTYQKKDSGNISEAFIDTQQANRGNGSFLLHESGYQQSEPNYNKEKSQNMDYRNIIVPKPKAKSPPSSAHRSEINYKQTGSEVAKSSAKNSRQRDLIPPEIRDLNVFPGREQDRIKGDNDETKQNRNTTRNFIPHASPSTTLIKNNPQISQLHARELLSKLLLVKHSLQEQISELKHLLDNTASYLETIDDQFNKIKEKIIQFTSKTLDAAFREYKNSLPNWIKYENIEHSGFNKLAQINALIQENETHPGILTQKQFNNSYDLQKRIEGYRQFTQDINHARKQCYSLRPLITEQRIKVYEQAVEQLGRF